MAKTLEIVLNDDGTVTGSWRAVEAACPTTTAGEGDGGGEGGGSDGSEEQPGGETAEATAEVTVTPGADEPSAEAAVAAETIVEPAEGSGEKPEGAPAPEATEGEGGEAKIE